MDKVSIFQPGFSSSQKIARLKLSKKVNKNWEGWEGWEGWEWIKIKPYHNRSNTFEISLDFPACYNSSYIEAYCGRSYCPDNNFDDVHINFTNPTCNDHIFVTATNTINVRSSVGIYCIIGVLGMILVVLCVEPIHTR